MKRWLPLLFLLTLTLWLAFPAMLLAQGQTPNIGLYTPATGSPNWGPLLNTNMVNLDLFLSGNSTLPGLLVSGTATFNNVVINGTCTGSGCSGGGGAVSSVSSANADIAVANGTTTPLLTLNSGTGANQIVKLNGSGFLPALNGSNLTSLTAGNLNGTVAVANGGTGAASFTIHGVLLGQTTGAFHATTAGTSGQVLTSNGAGADPTFQAAAGGTPGGTSGQTQYNNSGAFGGYTASGDFTIVPSTGVATVQGLNGTLLSGLPSGFLYNTTGTGIPSSVAPSGTKCYPFGGSGGTGCDTPSTGGTVTMTGTQTPTAIVTNSSSNVLQTASPGTTLDSSGNIIAAGTVTAANGFVAGTAPVGCPTSGAFCGTEAASSGTPTATTDWFRWDSTTHLGQVDYGTAGEVPIVVAPTSTTTTQALFATATPGKGGFRAIVTGDLPTIPIAGGGTNATTAAAALINLLPTATRVGDILYCSAYSTGACTAWSLLAGNNSGTKQLQETSSGVPSWVTGGSSSSRTWYFASRGICQAAISGAGLYLPAANAPTFTPCTGSNVTGFWEIPASNTSDTFGLFFRVPGGHTGAYTAELDFRTVATTGAATAEIWYSCLPAGTVQDNPTFTDTTVGITLTPAGTTLQSVFATASVTPTCADGSDIYFLYKFPANTIAQPVDFSYIGFTVQASL